MTQKSFPVPLQLELMALLWAILSVLIFIAYFFYKHPIFLIAAIVTVIIAVAYFIGSIYKSRKSKPKDIDPC